MTEIPAKKGLAKPADDQKSSDRLRSRLLEAARSVSDVPDPFASITLADIAAVIGKPESSILYQVEPHENADSLTVFRQRAYVRLVERFETRIGRNAHQAIVAALANGKSVPQTLADFCRAVSDQFQTDPATPYLLGARSRIIANRALEPAVERVWNEIATNVIDLIELIVASGQFRLNLNRASLNELARIALASGWTQNNLILKLDYRDVEVDGAVFEQTGLVLWTGIKASLTPTAAS